MAKQIRVLHEAGEGLRQRNIKMALELRTAKRRTKDCLAVIAMFEQMNMMMTRRNVKLAKRIHRKILGIRQWAPS